MERAQGGIIQSDSETTIMVRRLQPCGSGHALYSIDKGKPEHVITPDEIRAQDMTKVACQQTLDAQGCNGCD